MDTATLAALVLAGVAVVGAIGSVLLLSFRVGSLVGKVTFYMESSSKVDTDLRVDLTKLIDRVSMHIEHHGSPQP